MNFDELGDMTLDEAMAQANAQATEPTVTQPAAPETPAEPFLRTSTGTVYKSVEDAVRGTEHKDALIAKLRQDAIDRTGIDPVTGQPVQRAAQTQDVDYSKDGEKFLSDLKMAADKGDKTGYINTQSKFVLDHLKPFAPMLTGLAKQQAMDTVGSTYSDFKQFAHSTEYSQTLEENPMLKNAIAVSESDPSQTGSLPEFYKMAYRLNQSRKMPELLQSQPQAAAVVARPTIQSGATIAQTQARAAAPPSLNSPEGRKALMAEFEARGVTNMKW